MQNNYFLVVVNEQIRKALPKLPEHVSTMLIFGDREKDWYVSDYYYPGGTLGASFDGLSMRVYKGNNYICLPDLERELGKRFDGVRLTALNALKEDNSKNQ